MEKRETRDGGERDGKPQFPQTNPQKCKQPDSAKTNIQINQKKVERSKKRLVSIKRIGLHLKELRAKKKEMVGI